MVKTSDIVSFTYDGNDSMLGSWGSDDDKIPKCHPDFKATLKLKNGTEIDAPPKWRSKIWKWWITERREEVGRNILLQASRDMLRPNDPTQRSDIRRGL